jgi:hypothetical protein
MLACKKTSGKNIEEEVVWRMENKTGSNYRQNLKP